MSSPDVLSPPPGRGRGALPLCASPPALTRATASVGSASTHAAPGGPASMRANYPVRSALPRELRWPASPSSSPTDAGTPTRSSSPAPTASSSVSRPRDGPCRCSARFSQRRTVLLGQPRHGHGEGAGGAATPGRPRRGRGEGQGVRPPPPASRWRAATPGPPSPGSRQGAGARHVR